MANVLFITVCSIYVVAIYDPRLEGDSMWAVSGSLDSNTAVENRMHSSI